MTTVSPDVSQPSWVQIIRTAVDRQLARVHVALPGKIVSYDSSKQEASIELVVEHYDPITGELSVFPELQDVPVQHPHGGNFFVHMPLVAGDEVLVHFSEADPSHARTEGDTQPPANLRRHGLYGFAVPFRWSDDNKINDVSSTDLVIGKDDGGPVVHWDGTCVKLGSGTASEFVALANLVDANFTSLQSTFDGHTHLYNPGPSAPAPTAAPLPLIGSFPATAATKVKAE